MLAEAGPLSAREMAANLKRPVSGLYHHIAALEAVGLLDVHAMRPSARRPEKVYALVANRLSSRAASRTKAGRAALARTSRHILGATARNIVSALATNDAVTEGPTRNTSVRHIRVRLTNAAIAQLNERLDDLIHLTLAETNARGRPLLVTFAIAPAHRGRPDK